MNHVFASYFPLSFYKAIVSTDSDQDFEGTFYLCISTIVYAFCCCRKLENDYVEAFQFISCFVSQKVYHLQLIERTYLICSELHSTLTIICRKWGFLKCDLFLIVCVYYLWMYFYAKGLNLSVIFSFKCKFDVILELFHLIRWNVMKIFK